MRDIRNKFEADLTAVYGWTRLNLETPLQYRKQCTGKGKGTHTATFGEFIEKIKQDTDSKADIRGLCRDYAANEQAVKKSKGQKIPRWHLFGIDECIGEKENISKDSPTIKPTGFWCLDIDTQNKLMTDQRAEELKQMLGALPSCVMVARSVSGGGVFAVIAIADGYSWTDADWWSFKKHVCDSDHEESNFMGLGALEGLESLDSNSGKSPHLEQGRFESYDPDPLINTVFKPFCGTWEEGVEDVLKCAFKSSKLHGLAAGLLPTHEGHSIIIEPNSERVGAVLACLSIASNMKVRWMKSKERIIPEMIYAYFLAHSGASKGDIQTLITRVLEKTDIKHADLESGTERALNNTIADVCYERDEKGGFKVDENGENVVRRKENRLPIWNVADEIGDKLQAQKDAGTGASLQALEKKVHSGAFRLTSTGHDPRKGMLEVSLTQTKFGNVDSFVDNYDVSWMKDGDGRRWLFFKLRKATQSARKARLDRLAGQENTSNTAELENVMNRLKTCTAETYTEPQDWASSTYHVLTSKFDQQNHDRMLTNISICAAFEDVAGAYGYEAERSIQIQSWLTGLAITLASEQFKAEIFDGAPESPLTTWGRIEQKVLEMFKTPVRTDRTKFQKLMSNSETEQAVKSLLDRNMLIKERDGSKYRIRQLTEAELEARAESIIGEMDKIKPQDVEKAREIYKGINKAICHSMPTYNGRAFVGNMSALREKAIETCMDLLKAQCVKGQRNATLYAFKGWLYAKGLWADDVRQRMHEIGIIAGLSSHECDTVLRHEPKW